jgi:hypothetical protein
VSSDLATRIREELALALRDTRVTLPDLSPLERAEAERVCACVRVAELALDHEAISARARRAEMDLRSLASLVLEHLACPTVQSAAELRTVAGRMAGAA